MKIGVVVARFQVDELSAGHSRLLLDTASTSDVVCVVLGYNENRGSKKNPLDFLTRKHMVAQWWANQGLDPQRLVILPKHDRADDAYWSKELDSMLRETFPGHDLKLHGGRDSSLGQYSGSLTTVSIDTVVVCPSGTEVRSKIASCPGKSADFRRGVIYGAYDQWPRTLMCVDVAVVSGDWVILGKKKADSQLRFFGGFVNQGETLEAAARRELLEESGIVTAMGPKYIGSFPVSDYRYATPDDGKVLSAFFLAKTDVFLNAKAGDDIDSIEAIHLDQMAVQAVVPSHRMMMAALLDEVKK